MGVVHQEEDEYAHGRNKRTHSKTSGQMSL